MKNIKFRPKIGQFPTRPNQPPGQGRPNPPQILVKTKPDGLSGPKPPQNHPKKGSKWGHFWVILTQPKTTQKWVIFTNFGVV